MTPGFLLLRRNECWISLPFTRICQSVYPSCGCNRSSRHQNFYPHNLNIPCIVKQVAKSTRRTAEVTARWIRFDFEPILSRLSLDDLHPSLLRSSTRIFQTDDHLDRYTCMHGEFFFLVDGQYNRSGDGA
jgi:hypothetical protein